MSWYSPNVVSVREIHYIFGTILSCILVNMLRSLFYFISCFINTLNPIDSKCIFLGPYFDPNDFKISSFSQNISICESFAFAGCLTFFIILDMCLVSDWLSIGRGLQLGWIHFRLLLNNFLLIRFGDDSGWFDINFFYFCL